MTTGMEDVVPTGMEDAVAAGTNGQNAEMSMTLEIATLWFRAPEVCLRCRDYGLPADMWALGCVCVEVLSNKVAFQGTSEMHMMSLIFGKFGLPSASRWNDLYKSARPDVIERLYAKMPASGGPTWVLGEACDFVSKLLVPSPAKRLTAASASKHAFSAV